MEVGLDWRGGDGGRGVGDAVEDVGCALECEVVSIEGKLGWVGSFTSLK